MKHFLKDSNSVFNEQEKELQAFLSDGLLFLFHSQRAFVGRGDKERGSKQGTKMVYKQND